ncbi:LysR family transcriptional regulator [Burkholderia sp. WAC0059]|uniref:LysR family transcriptional regulator n=1 Tax=Burkholderia sp. WAC0059 TaxID=2066022 RepID=UPI000C7F45F9|nr:LysR family transcriptional regulator [Burkholderia sp. WAC0059]PLZ03173.1 LysR family transcriptional regulator [Burkholderia sp. WAC0059]
MLYSEEINTFLAIVRCGSLLQAADIVCATQSTVSYRIQSLERRLGKSLILRSRGSKRVTLTPEGERFVDIAERWKLLEREVMQMKSTADRYLSIGSADVAALHLLPPFIERLSLNSTAYRLHVESGRYWSLHNRVASGHLHVAFTFVAASHADLRSEPIASYPVHIVYRPSATSPASGPASWRDLDVDKEVYVPYSAEIDHWRETRSMSKLTDSVDKNHLLAPLLTRPGRWALVPEFMIAWLTEQTGCQVLRLDDDPPPSLVLYKTTKRTHDELSSQDQAVIDEALAPLRESKE